MRFGSISRHRRGEKSFVSPLARLAGLCRSLALRCGAVALAGCSAWAGSAEEYSSGDLVLGFEAREDGLSLTRLYDQFERRELLATNTPALFQLVLRRAGGTNALTVDATRGWRSATLRRTRRGFEARWDDPRQGGLGGIAVVATAVADARSSAWRWRLRVENTNTDWSVWRATFPQVALASLGKYAGVFYPRGAGEVQSGLWDRRLRIQNTYPNGWCSMQFVAAFTDAVNPAGLYLGLHDPWGSVKDIGVESDPVGRTVRFWFDHPAEDMGVAGNEFDLSGEAVWQLLRGDWFDAALIYKSWAKREAHWWPRKAGARLDTPAWMRGLNAWAQTGGPVSECVTNVLRFREFLGEPVGFHWYNWHQIPFDNDYPHYFPAKPDFAAGVETLEKAGVHVMPYINGRLWDTHDRGAEDYEFSRLALPATAKRPDGQPFVETYSSRETNGQKVALAVMCPTTRLWQETVQGIVLRLLDEYGASGVYIDQITAASPALCMDALHRHPLGGGHWWNEGYWRMLEAMRQSMPAGTMLTSECNSEPFLRWLDGYLTWHWQFEGQVPAFPAVYGGTIQMFGRAYRGGPTKNLALRMKAAQQLVFGEQLGWLDPGIINEPENAMFFRDMVRRRAQFNRYFTTGEMARPPRFTTPTPKVKADWQWSGEWWVTTDAVLTGAWQIPAEKRMVLLFINVSDEQVKTSWRFDPPAYGLRSGRFRLQTNPGGPGEPARLTAPFTQELILEGRKSQAWELSW